MERVENLIRPVLGGQEIHLVLESLDAIYESVSQDPYPLTASEGSSVARAIGLTLGCCGGLDLMALAFDTFLSGYDRGIERNRAARWLTDIWHGLNLGGGEQWINRDLIEYQAFIVIKE